MIRKSVYLTIALRWIGCVASLVSLLAHENTDIAIDAIQTLSELTDEDVQAEQEQWDSLVNAMV